MTMEIDAFIRHHNDVCSYQQQSDVRQRAKEAVLAQRSAYVSKALEMYDRKLLVDAEARLWKWSPLFLRLLEKPVPGFLTLPCRHNEEEFQDILTWIRTECRRQEGKTTAPPFVRALKLFSRGENGVDAPMICPRVGVSPGSCRTECNKLNLRLRICQPWVSFCSLQWTSRRRNSKHSWMSHPAG